MRKHLEYKPAEFMNLADAQAYLQFRPVSNMILTTEGSIMEIDHSITRIFAKTSDGLEYCECKQDLPAGEVARAASQALITLDKGMLESNPKIRYMVEFNIPSPFLK